MTSAASSPSGHDYQRRTSRRQWALAVAVLLTCGSFLVDLMTGPAALSVKEIFATLFQPETVSESQQVIIWTFRLPTALLAIAVGAALGLAGGQMQTVLNNPLASPYTLGVSAAAGFGAALVIVCGAEPFGLTSTLAVPAGAFVSAVLCSLLLVVICRLRDGSAETLIVGGVALHFLFSSGLALLQYMATSDALPAIVFWTFGSLQGATWEKVAILAAAVLVVLALILPQAWKLTALQLGTEYASSLGVDVDGLRLRTMLLVSVLTATAVCFTGSIGFVGLIAPHLARLVVGEDQRFLIPFSAAAGALLVSMASVLCKTVAPGTVFPVGILTAAIGAPCFALLALSSRRGRS